MEKTEKTEVQKLQEQKTLQDVMSQFSQEVGDQELTSKEMMALRMKYGLSAMILTPSEKYLIQKYS